MALTLEIGNSYSQIIGLKTVEFRQLRKLLSYENDPQAAYFSGGFTRVKYLIDSKGNFPTGLLSKVRDFCSQQKRYLAIQDNRLKPRANLRTCVYTTEPYPAQVAATESAISVGRGTISMPTGSGKTKVIQMIADRLHLRTLVVVPNLGIKKQLTEVLGCPNVVVENIDSKRLKTLTNFDCLIIDEAHHVSAKTYQDLNKTAWTNIYYRFFLTATPFRNQSNETLLFEAIAGDLIYGLTYKGAVATGSICPVEAYYIQLPRQACDGYTWAQVYSQLVVNNTVRNETIALTLLKLNASNVSTLCLVKEVEHGNILSALSGLPFVSGQTGDRELIESFSRGEIKTLIATNGVCGEGIDTKACEFVVIAGLGKAKSAFMQQVGRAVRKYPGKETAKVILFSDRSHKFTMRHFSTQKKILADEYDTTCIKLDM